MSVPVDSVRQSFAQQALRSDDDIELARVALLIAKERYPQLSIELYLSRLDQLSEEVKDRLNRETAPLVVLQEMVDTLYRRHGLKGNKDAYYDPRNSFLNDVLDRQLGIPLSLGIVFLEVGWRLELPLEGVDFPHHFLVRYKGSAVDLLIDPFDAGKTLFEDQAQGLLDRVYGGVVRLKPSFLLKAGRRAMLVRMLRNLKSLYLNVGDADAALAAVERILLLRPDLTVERRAEGILLARLGRRDEALEHLQAYLDVSPDAADVDRVRRLMSRLAKEEDHDDTD